MSVNNPLHSHTDIEQNISSSHSSAVVETLEQIDTSQCPSQPRGTADIEANNSPLPTSQESSPSKPYHSPNKRRHSRSNNKRHNYYYQQEQNQSLFIRIISFCFPHYNDCAFHYTMSVLSLPFYLLFIPFTILAILVLLLFTKTVNLPVGLIFAIGVASPMLLVWLPIWVFLYALTWILLIGTAVLDKSAYHPNVWRWYQSTSTSNQEVSEPPHDANTRNPWSEYTRGWWLILPDDDMFTAKQLLILPVTLTIFWLRED